MQSAVCVGIGVLQQGGDIAYMDIMCADAPALRDDVLIYEFIWWWCCDATISSHR